MHATPVEAGDPFHLKTGKYQLILGQDGATLSYKVILCLVLLRSCRFHENIWKGALQDYLASELIYMIQDASLPPSAKYHTFKVW